MQSPNQDVKHTGNTAHQTPTGVARHLPYIWPVRPTPFPLPQTIAVQRQNFVDSSQTFKYKLHALSSNPSVGFRSNA
jgi:hypothetical protein